MDIHSLDNVGNIDDSLDQYQQPYRYMRRTAIPQGVLSGDDYSLKMYHMKRENENMPEHLASTLPEFLDREMHSDLDTHQNIGFAILSQGFLSINLWGRGNVLFTSTYTVEDSETLSRKPLEKTGVACTWENRIMHFEYEAWQTFLESPMGVQDKKDYLETFISGNLWGDFNED